MKKHKDEYEKEYKDVETLVTMGVNVGWIPLEERDIIITLVQEYLSAEIWMDPTDIKETEDGDFIPRLSLNFLKGILERNEQKKKKMRLGLGESEEYTKNEDTPKARELPQDLNTPKAKEILQRCIDSGHLDKDFQPIKGTTTKGQLFYIALYTSYMLWNTARWKPFERLWGAPNLQQEKVWLMAQWRKESIDALFSKDIIEKALKLG